jgi:hypothetical protein
MNFQKMCKFVFHFENDYHFKSHQNMLAILGFNFLYDKLRLCFIFDVFHFVSFFHFPLPFFLPLMLALQMYIQNMNMYVMSLNEPSTTLEVDFSIVPFKPKLGNEIMMPQKDFDSWVAKVPWAKLCLGSNGDLHIIKCRACSEVEGKDKLLVFTCEIFFVSMQVIGKLTRILKLM